MIESTIRLSVEVEFHLPPIPAQLAIVGTDASIPLTDLDDDEIERIGEAWTRALLDSAAKLRKERRAAAATSNRETAE